MSDLPALPVTFRPGRTRAVLLTAGVAIFVVITAVAMLLEQLTPGERLSFVFTAAVLFGVLLLLSRPKVVADESGVTVVNIASRRRLDWAEILQVNLRPGDPWVFLNLSDGTSLPALGIQPGIARQRAIEDARTLRALAEARSIKDAERSTGESEG
ncbi:PH domain-containing protein [Streptomyces sp. NPDC046197]|uniref:PH domain-containing protein n=1 Tax=Streptomyces sp. NPDC046197 TaxID=3154337 RepID=UPI0033C4BAFA